MTHDFTHFQLYDTDILDLMWSRQTDAFLAPRPDPEDSEGVFDDLQEKDLIYAVTQLNYPRVYSLLRKLDHPLSPTDAMTACLCALNGTPRLMNALLDHCPPIPTFQFQGVGQASSLLCVAAEYDRYTMLDILLRRGADPNSGPGDAKSPVEAAFCSHAYSSLKRLLEAPDIKIPLTEEMLDAWGSLTSDITASPFCNPCSLWCCQLLQERLTGEPTSLFDPLPVPPGLRLCHALHHANFELAAHICNLRPLTDTDAADVLAHYAPERLDCTLLSKGEMENDSLSAKREQEVRFLCQLLRCRPDLLQAPQLRPAIVLADLALPEEDPFLTYWVRQMEAGPVLLPRLPIQQDLLLDGCLFEVTYSIDPAFFTRWKQRLGTQLIPAMDINAHGFRDMNPDMVREVLERIHLTGTPPTDALSACATQLLLHAPEALLPDLLQPGGLLAQEQSHLLLDACHALPASRRNLILPHIHKSTSYAL